MLSGVPLPAALAGEGLEFHLELRPVLHAGGDAPAQGAEAMKKGDVLHREHPDDVTMMCVNHVLAKMPLMPGGSA